MIVTSPGYVFAKSYINFALPPGYTSTSSFASKRSSLSFSKSPNPSFPCTKSAMCSFCFPFNAFFDPSATYTTSSFSSPFSSSLPFRDPDDLYILNNFLQFSVAFSVLTFPNDDVNASTRNSGAHDKDINTANASSIPGSVSMITLIGLFPCFFARESAFAGAFVVISREEFLAFLWRDLTTFAS